MQCLSLQTVSNRGEQGLNVISDKETHSCRGHQCRRGCVQWITVNTVYRRWGDPERRTRLVDLYRSQAQMKKEINVSVLFVCWTDLQLGVESRATLLNVPNETQYSLLLYGFCTVACYHAAMTESDLMYTSHWNWIQEHHTVNMNFHYRQINVLYMRIIRLNLWLIKR
jgi:hypothetical protein